MLSMQRELELKVELSKSDVERLAGELPVSDLAAGEPVRKKIRGSISTRSTMIFTQSGLFVSVT